MGVLFGAAIVARLDAILLAPAVMLIGYHQHGLGRAFWSRALVFTIAALVPVVLVPAALGANILDVVAVTRHAIVLWDAFRPTQHARELSLFLGIPAAILVALGCLALVRRRDYMRLLLLVGVPTLFNVIALERSCRHANSSADPFPGSTVSFSGGSMSRLHSPDVTRRHSSAP